MTTYTVTNGNNAGLGSLRWAVAQANNNNGLDTIEFGVDLVTLTNAIAINDSVDINGDDVTINQTGTYRLFNINDNSDELIDVSFNNVTLTGGRPAEFGGAIFSLENLTINESVIRNNVTAKRGGGIYSEGASLTITNSTFEENEVVDGSTSFGGAFYIQDGIVEVDNSTLSNNKSSAKIAAIYNSTGNISNSKFNNNNGGAVLVSSNSIATIDQVEIVDNINQTNGAGIGAEDNAQVTIFNSIVDNNQSEYGAGIFIADSELEITNSIVSNNNASEAGGGFNVVGTGELTIQNSTISGNTSLFGSALETSESGTAFIVDAAITDNTGSQSQLEGENIIFGGGNTGGILDPNPLVEEPVTEEPVTEEPATEEPAVEEPATEEPATEEPVTEEPATEEPATEEPAVEEPAVEEPATEEPVTEESMTELSLDLVSVERFYQTEKGFHFYTADANESQSIQTQSEAGELNYSYENTAFSGLASNTDSLTGEVIENAEEVYRFYNSQTGAHLFTMDENERAYIQDNLDNYSFEGTAYYAFESEQSGFETVPVYRMLNGDTGTHLFSADQNEIGYIQDNLDNYTTEGENGIAFYVLEL